jgi:hypothetical protein
LHFPGLICLLALPNLPDEPDHSEMYTATFQIVYQDRRPQSRSSLIPSSADFDGLFPFSVAYRLMGDLASLFSTPTARRGEPSRVSSTHLDSLGHLCPWRDFRGER